MTNKEKARDYYFDHIEAIEGMKKALVVHCIIMQYIEEYGEKPSEGLVEEIYESAIDYIEEVSFGSIEPRVSVAISEICEEEGEV